MRSKGTVPLEEIPEADENLASSLWREVRKKLEEDRSGRASLPFPFMEENHPLEDKWAADSLNCCTATRSLYGEHKEEPNIEKYKESKEDLEGIIASQVLSSLVTCTIPLKDLLRLKPGVWKRMAKKLSIPDEEVPKPLLKPQKPKSQKRITSQSTE